jgi:hypothetical protein
MSQVVEVSEGLGLRNRVFELPVPDTNREEPRYLTIVGSLVDSLMATNRPWTKLGGVGVANPCLRYAKNFLRRAWITPLLKDTHDFKPYDYVKKIVDGEPTEYGYFRQVVPPGFTVPFLPPARGGGYGNIPSPTGNMVGRVAYPGEQISGILTGNTNFFDGAPRGIVELPIKQAYRPTLLPNGLYVDSEIWKIQSAIFPDYPVFLDADSNPTVLLTELLRIIDEAKVHTLLRPIVDKFEESAIQFEAYATVTIENSEAKMREIAATTKGYIPRYTPVELVLIEQLGRKRKDRIIQEAVKTAGDPELRDMFKQFIALQVEEKIANKEREGRVAEPVASLDAGDSGQEGTSGISGASGASGQIAVSDYVPQVSGNTLEKFECACGKQAGSKAGLLAHQRHCEAVKAQNEQDNQ